MFRDLAWGVAVLILGIPLIVGSVQFWIDLFMTIRNRRRGSKLGR
jgi:hypothetical protein